MAIVSFDEVSMAFGHLPLLERAALRIDPGERIAVIGRNGAGKSTLLRLLSGELTPDAGTIWHAPALRVARLAQDAPPVADETVFDLVAGGLDALRDVVRDYHHAATAVSHDPSPARLAELGRLQHALEEQDGWRVEQRVELVLDRLSLDPDAPAATLSGGWRRRALLARALVGEPTLLLLDEPTNHLDIEAIEWLETFLAAYAGAIVFVTHDRAFLQRLATRIVELDRGHLRSWPGTYASFLERKEAWLANEALAEEKFDTLMAREEAWLRRGVKARRTRDEGRVKALMRMREERAARRTQAGAVAVDVDASTRSGRLVFEVDDVSKGYAGRSVVSHVSARVMRGDRVGLIGPNGAGKTTLLRLLIGDLPPDSGDVHQGANVQVAYFDQQREQLDPDATVVETVAEGNDTVTIGGQPRHVYGYLEDFLFPRERARSPVRSLSGGERNRLLLARLFTRPANVLVLDEPTNDLDIETLEVVEAMLASFPGTILLVSHDRTFLDHVVTSTLVFEGDGRVEEYVGGYEDWERMRTARASMRSAELVAAGAEKTMAGRPAPSPPRGAPAGPAARKRLSYTEQREYDALPARIEALEAEAARLHDTIASPDFYKEGAEAVRTTLARVEAVREELDAAFARWDALDSRAR
jgi:ATP-binding cassette subfamily F protein uup